MANIEIDGLFINIRSGVWIGDAFKEVLALAKREGENVNFIFNDRYMKVFPNDSIEEIESRWNFKTR